jgi:excisionase family DNA binding protein
MPELLTVKQLQEILQVDRTTIYRMLDSGELSGFKVGSQWRFSRSVIEKWLQSRQQQTFSHEPSPPATAPTRDILPWTCVQAVQDVFAEALDIGAITTDPGGHPLTEFSNCNPYCALINGTASGRRRCQQSWARLGKQQEERPEIARCHAGLSYARGRIRIDGRPVAMTFAGQFKTEVTGEVLSDSFLQEVATACQVSFEDLRRASQHVRTVPLDEAEQITHLLGRIAYTFCHIGQERADLMGRLTHIAKLTTPVVDGLI